MSESTDVKVKLVVDSNSKAATDRLKVDLQQANTNVASLAMKMGSNMGGGLKAGAVMMGNLYAKAAEVALDKGKDLFTAPIEAFMESQKQVKALAATFSLLDQGGNSMQSLKMFATQTKDELEEMGMRIGVSDDALVSVFNNVIERGGKSVDQAKALTEQMALAGRIIPGGAVEISEAFESIQMGVIRARNPIVGMVASTGLLKGNAKQVASQMQAMSPEKAMALGEKAIAKMATKMKDAPMSMKEAMTSMKVMGENLLETMGEPMTKALSKAVVGIRGLFFTPEGQATKLTTDLTAGFKVAGEFLENAFTAVMPFVDGIISGFGAFSTETKAIWGEVFGDGVSQWETIRQIAKAVGLALGFMINGMVAGVGVLVLGAQKFAKLMAEALAAIIGGIGEILNMAAKLTQTIDSMLMGATQISATFKDAANSFKEASAQTSLFAKGTEQRETLAKLRQTGGGNAEELRTKYMANVQQSGVTDNSEYIEQVKAAYAERQVMEANVQSADAALKLDQAATYLATFQFASDQHDKAAMKNIANFLDGNATMAIAIGNLAPDIIKGGVSSFTAALREAGKTELADIIDEKQRAKLAIGPKGGGNNIMNGGQTFNIKQDFRDQDPDRIAVIFRKDIAKTATSRLQARGNVTGLGGL